MTMQTIRCDDIHARLGTWYDGEITGADAETIAAHVEACPRCAGKSEAMREIDLLLTIDVETEGFDERVLAAVRGTRRPSAAWWVRVAAAAAAALALGVLTARSLPERSSPDHVEARAEVFASLDQHFGARANAGFDDLAAELGRR